MLFNNRMGKTNNIRETGTTTVGIVCSDGVVLATDMRATSGYYIAHKKVNKIFKVCDYAAATMAGTVADAQKLLDYVRAVVNYHYYTYGEKLPVKAIATLIANILVEARTFPYLIHTIVAGVDSYGPSMYVIDWFGTLTKERYIATGSGSQVALGVLEEFYSDKITVKDAIKVAVRAVYSAIKRDPASGEGINIAVITEKEGVTFLGPNEVRRIVEGLAKL